MARRSTPSRSSWGRALVGAHEECADQGGDYAHAGDEEGQDDAGAVGDDRAERGGSDNRAAIALKQVRAHAGHVADIVTHVVGDDRGIARVVFGDALLDFADEVSADVGGFGVDAAADTGEEGDRTGAKTEAGDVAHVAIEEEVEDRHAEQAETDDGHAHDRAAAEGDAQAVIQALAGGGGGAHVGAHGDEHAEVPGRARGDRAEDKAERGLPRQEDGDDDGDDDDKSAQEGVLPFEKCRRALLDGGGDLLHHLVAVVHREDAARLHDQIDEAEESDNEGKSDRRCAERVDPCAHEAKR